MYEDGRVGKRRCSRMEIAGWKAKNTAQEGMQQSAAGK